MSSPTAPDLRPGSAGRAAPGRPGPSPGESHLIWHAARRAEDAADVEGAARLLAALRPSTGVLLWREDLRRRQSALVAGCPVRVSLALLGAAHRWAGGTPRRQRLLTLARVLTTSRPETPPGRVPAAVLATFDPLVRDVALFDDEALAAYLDEVRPSPPVDTALLLAVAGTAAAVLDLGPPGSQASPVHLFGRPGTTREALPPLWDEPDPATRGLVYGRPVPVSGRTVLPLDALRLSPLEAGRVHRTIIRRSPPAERLRLLARPAR